MKMSWQNFCDEFCSKNYIYTLLYKDEVYTVGSESCGREKIFFFSSEHASCPENYINLEFGSPQALLSNVMLQGKRLAEVWDDVVID